MNKEAYKKDFIDNSQFGISNPETFGGYVSENKHGIDDPVKDLNIDNQNGFGNVNFNSSQVLSPQTYILQDQSGIVTLQDDLFTINRFPFANADGVLTDDALYTTTTMYRQGGTDVALADGGTGASLADPNVNALLGWDDVDTSSVFIIIGTGLTYDHSTHTLSASTGGSQTPWTSDIDADGFNLENLANLNFTGDSININVTTQTVTDVDGGSVNFLAGTGNGVGNGGGLNLNGGFSGTPGGFPGGVFLSGVQTTGKPFDSGISATDAINGNGGDLLLFPGAKGGTGTIGGKVRITDRDSNIQAILDTTLLTTSDKTFSFPDSSGTFALGNSGFYTPSSTNVTNITSSTPNNATYIRIGNIVNVFGTITVTNTLAIASEVDVSLPIASNLGAATDLNGSATMDSTASVNIYIKGDATNDRASIFFTSAGIGQTSTLYYSFQYKVI